MIHPGPERCHHRGRRRRIAESHGEVAQPALVADAPDRRALQALVELGLRPGEELDQGGAVEAVAHLEIGLCGRLCKGIPRADQLAVVAAVDAVADQRPPLLRAAALELDAELRAPPARTALVR